MQTRTASSPNQQLLNAATSRLFLPNALVACVEMDPVGLSIDSLIVCNSSPEANQKFNPLNIKFQAVGVTSGTEGRMETQK